MRTVLSRYFYRGIVVVGILLLAGLVSADIWLWQRDDGSGQAAGAGPGTQDGFMVPGLPARNTSGASAANNSDESEVRQEETPEPPGGASDAASIEDSVELVVRDSEGNIKLVETVK